MSESIKTRSSPYIKRLLVTKGLRAFGDGYVSLLLPLYLLELGLSPLQVGIVATTTLLGSGLLTLLVGLHAYRYHYRTLLLGAALLMAGTGLGRIQVAREPNSAFICARMRPAKMFIPTRSEYQKG